MADMKIRYEELLAHRKGEPPLPTAVVYPCSEERSDRQDCRKEQD